MIEQLQPRGGTEKVFRITVGIVDVCYRPYLSGRKPRLFIRQAVEKVPVLTHPTPARRDAPFPVPRSQLIEILNVSFEIL